MPRLSSALAVTQHHGTALHRGRFASIHRCSRATPIPSSRPGRCLRAERSRHLLLLHPGVSRAGGQQCERPTGKAHELGLQSTPECGRRSPASPDAEGQTADTDLSWWRLGAASGGGGVAIATCQTPALRATGAAPGGEGCAGTRHHTLVPTLSTGDGAGATHSAVQLHALSSGFSSRM